MDTYNVLHGGSEHSVRIVVSQVLLDGKGKLLKVCDTLDVLGLNACFVHFLAVGCYVFINTSYSSGKTVGLESLQLASGSTFDLGLIVFHGIFLFS